ncbi:hypothetical protein RFI_37158, partial [Reticulomyxa filosa]
MYFVYKHNIIKMSFVLHHGKRSFVFGISNIINNYKYLMDVPIVFVVLNFLHLMVVDIYVHNNKNDNKSNSIGVIGDNGYTICSGSGDNFICVWDIETTKQMIVFKKHEGNVKSVRYGSNELKNIGCANTILSGSYDKSVRLWDIRSGQQIQVFIGHSDWVCAVEYSPFIVNNKIIGGSSNVICSGSWDNTIRFWDVRSNKSQLYVINVDDGKEKSDDGNGEEIICLKF